MTSANGPQFPQGHRYAFTLTEILVVVGIVLLLSAILFPIVSKVKQAGQQTTCASNLRQIGMALQAYTQDSRGVYPPHESYGDNCVWTHRLLRYIKSPSVFECPSYPAGLFDSACSKPDLDVNPIQWYNGGYNWNATYPPRLPTLTQNAIRQPTNMVLVCDGDATYSATMTPVSAPATTVADLGVNNLRARHGQGVNALFADGHVKWLSLEKLLDKSLWKYR